MEYFKVIAREKCHYCIKAKVHLKHNNLPFEYCSVDSSEELLSYYKTIYKHDTVPIIILKGGEMDDKFIGGYTELVSFLERRTPSSNTE